MKSLKINLLDKNIINDEISPSITIGKSMKTMDFVCCILMSCLCCCCCCMVNTIDILCNCLCKMMNKNYKYVKYRTTGLFMKCFINTSVVFCV